MHAAPSQYVSVRHIQWFLIFGPLEQFGPLVLPNISGGSCWAQLSIFRIAEGAVHHAIDVGGSENKGLHAGRCQHSGGESAGCWQRRWAR